jgi:hypothetical protein
MQEQAGKLAQVVSVFKLDSSRIAAVRAVPAKPQRSVDFAPAKTTRIAAAKTGTSSAAVSDWEEF